MLTPEQIKEFRKVGRDLSYAGLPIDELVISLDFINTDGSVVSYSAIIIVEDEEVIIAQAATWKEFIAELKHEHENLT